MLRSTTARSALLTITTMLVVGCGGATASTTPSPTAAPSPTATAAATASPEPSASASAAASQATTGRIEVQGKGFAITLPEGWQSLPVDPATLQSVLAGVDPESDWGKLIKQTIDSGQLSQLSLWAMDMNADPIGTRNVTILTQPAASIPFSLVETSLKGQLSAIQGVGEITATTVTLPAGDALRLHYSIEVPSAAGQTVSSEQALYWIQGNKVTVVLTVTGKGAATDAVFKSIVESVEEI